MKCVCNVDMGLYMRGLGMQSKMFSQMTTLSKYKIKIGIIIKNKTE